MATSEHPLLVSLDIGTSKIVTLVGKILPSGQIQVMGVGLAPSRGLKRGVVIDMEEAVHSIQESVAEAEKAAGCKINSTFTGIAGTHISSVNSQGVVAVKGEITPHDVARVIEAAKAIPLATDHKPLQVLVQDFIIDNQPGIREPVGMSGVRLEVKVHVVTGAISAAQNIIKCVQRCGLTPTEIILEQLASSYAVLSEDEKELGACVIDIGGGTTDIAVFTSGSIRHTGVIPIAGDQVTQDIAIALRIPSQHAEQIKLRHGHACVDAADDKEKIDLHDFGEILKQNASDEPFTAKQLADFIEPRYEEILNLVNDQLEQIGIKPYLGAGIVLTGGASLARGLTDLSHKIFKLPTRVGIPQDMLDQNSTLKSPIYATSVGLLRYGYQEHYGRNHEIDTQSGWKNAWAKVKNWFYGYL